MDANQVPLLLALLALLATSCMLLWAWEDLLLPEDVHLKTSQQKNHRPYAGVLLEEVDSSRCQDGVVSREEFMFGMMERASDRLPGAYLQRWRGLEPAPPNGGLMVLFMYPKGTPWEVLEQAGFIEFIFGWFLEGRCLDGLLKLSTTGGWLLAKRPNQKPPVVGGSRYIIPPKRKVFGASQNQELELDHAREEGKTAVKKHFCSTNRSFAENPAFAHEATRAILPARSKRVTGEDRNQDGQISREEQGSLDGVRFSQERQHGVDGARKAPNWRSFASPRDKTTSKKALTVSLSVFPNCRRAEVHGRHGSRWAFGVWMFGLLLVVGVLLPVRVGVLVCVVGKEFLRGQMGCKRVFKLRSDSPLICCWERRCGWSFGLETAALLKPGAVATAPACRLHLKRNIEDKLKHALTGRRCFWVVFLVPSKL